MFERQDEPEEKPAEDAQPVSANARMGFVITLAIALSFTYASFYPHQLVLPAASNVLVALAIGAAALATMRLQTPIAPYLTFWDKAVVMMFVATGALMVHELPGMQAYFETLPPLETATTDFEAPAVEPVEPAAVDPQPAVEPVQDAGVNSDPIAETARLAAASADAL